MNPPERDAFQDYCEKSVNEIENAQKAAEEPAEAVAEVEPSAAASLPPCHRALNPDEKLRRGDRGLRRDTMEWEQIPDTLRGCPPQSSSGPYAAYRRPMPPNAMTWYVSKDGTPDAFGTSDDPFDSVETARQKIESNCRKLGLDPCGVILDLKGNILFAYDPPEPEPIPESEAGSGGAKEETLPVPEGYYQIKRLTRIQRNDLVEQDGEWVSAAKLVNKRAGNRKIIRKKHKNDPHQNTRGNEEGLKELTAAVREVAVELRSLRSAFSSKF